MTKANTSQISLFESSDGEVVLDVPIDVGEQEVWLSKEQMGTLFGRNRTVISRHISNIYKEGELSQNATCANFAQVQKEGSQSDIRSNLMSDSSRYLAFCLPVSF